MLQQTANHNTVQHVKRSIKYTQYIYFMINPLEGIVKNMKILSSLTHTLSFQTPVVLSLLNMHIGNQMVFGSHDFLIGQNIQWKSVFGMTWGE